MNEKLKQMTIKTCKAMLASPISIKILCSISKNGPIMKKDVIGDVWYEFPKASEYRINEKFNHLVKMRLIQGETIEGNNKLKSYSINEFFIKQSIDNLKELVLGGNE